MASEDFYFCLEFSRQSVPSGLLGELTCQVLCQVGCASDESVELPRALEHAVATGGWAGADRHCDIKFRVHGGTLDIVVSSNGGCVWRTSCLIP